MGVRSFRDLEVWQQGMALVRDCYELTRRLPSDERFSLVTQMQRAAISVPANIAEGWALGKTRAYLRHLGIARGSLAELQTYLYVIEDLKYVDTAATAPLLDLVTRIGRMLNGLITALKRRLDKP